MGPTPSLDVFEKRELRHSVWKHSHDYSDIAVLFQHFGRPRIQITAQGRESLMFSTDRSTNVRAVPQIRLHQRLSIKAIKGMIQ